jgi:hypothetical protein
VLDRLDQQVQHFDPHKMLHAPVLPREPVLVGGSGLHFHIEVAPDGSTARARHLRLVPKAVRERNPTPCIAPFAPPIGPSRTSTQVAHVHHRRRGPTAAHTPPTLPALPLTQQHPPRSFQDRIILPCPPSRSADTTPAA